MSAANASHVPLDGNSNFSDKSTSKTENAYLVFVLLSFLYHRAITKNENKTEGGNSATVWASLFKKNKSLAGHAPLFLFNINKYENVYNAPAH